MKEKKLNKDINEYFRQPLILFISVISFITIIPVIVQLILSKSNYTSYLFIGVLNIGNIICSLAFLMFYYKAKNNKSLKLPAMIFYWYHLIKLIFIIVVMIAIITLSLIYIKGAGSIVILFSVIGIVLLLSNLAQFAFSYSLKKSVYEHKKIETGLKAAETISYICAIVMFAQTTNNKYTILGIISIITTSLCYAFKGIVIREYRKFDNPQFNRRKKWKTLQT